MLIFWSFHVMFASAFHRDNIIADDHIFRCNIIACNHNFHLVEFSNPGRMRERVQYIVMNYGQALVNNLLAAITGIACCLNDEIRANA